MLSRSQGIPDFVWGEPGGSHDQGASPLPWVKYLVSRNRMSEVVTRVVVVVVVVVVAVSGKW